MPVISSRKNIASCIDHPIGSYDTMIAGHARSAGLILITNNQREFKKVKGLRLENWVKEK